MKKILLFSASILALSATPSFAQTAAKKTAAPKARVEAESKTPAKNVYKLGEIAVSVVDETTQVGSRSVISAEEIQAYADSDRLDKAISLLPGVNLTKVGRKNETSVSIRGFEMRQVVVMIDGVQSAVPYDYYPDLARYLTTDISKIQVSKGLSSVLAGPNTMGGIINLVTKRPTKEIEGDISVTAKMGVTGAYNGILTSANVGTNQGNWYLQAGAAYDDISRWSVSRNYSPTINQNGSINENGGFRDTSESKDFKFNVKLGFTPNETDEYAIAYNYSNAEFEMPAYAGYSYSSGQAMQLTRPFYRKYPYYDKQTIYTLTNTAIGDTGYIKSRLFYDGYKNRMDFYSDRTYTAPDPTTDNSVFNDYDLGGSVEAGADLFAQNTTKVAFHYRRDVHKSKDVDAPDFERNTDDTFSVALENTWHATANTDVIAGISYDWLKVQQSEGLHKQDDNVLNPMMAVRHKYSDDGTVYAGVSQKSRFATQKSRYGRRTGNRTGIANPYLKAEKAINYEVGFSDTFASRVKVDAAVFYTRIRDTNIETKVAEPTPGACNGGVCYQTQNMGRAESYGFEFASSTKVTDSFDLGLAYTFMIKDLDGETAKERDLKPINVPKHKLTIYGDWRITEELSLIPSIDAYSSRYSTIGGNNMVNGAVQIHGTQVGTGINQIDGTKVGGFATAGLKVKYAPTKKLEISAGVDNIFDKNYSLTEGYPEEGRNYFVTLTAKF